MNRFTIMVIALGVAFLSGWLFANEVQPPTVQDLGFAMWFVGIGVAFMAAMMASSTARG